MNSQWYAGEGSFTTTDLFCGEEPAEAVFESEGTASVADQIRELLGEDCELEASFLEDSWASGRPLASASCRRKQSQATTTGWEVHPVEWNLLGSFLFSTVNGLMGGRPGYARGSDSTSCYRAEWLRDPLEESASGTGENAAVGERADCSNQGNSEDTLGAMTCLRACALLGVSEGCTLTQIRSAYRQMVGEWHPDRMEQRDERVRSFATKQMAAINAAYHLLREVAPARVC